LVISLSFWLVFPSLEARDRANGASRRLGAQKNQYAVKLFIQFGGI
jgi:hypothetical protein